MQPDINRTGPWRAAAASAIGERHVADAKGCEDAHVVRTATIGGERWLIAVSADGAGSAAHAAAGARLAAGAFADAVGASLAALADGPLPPALVRGWILAARARLAAEAEAAGEPLRAFAATLLAAVVGEQRSVFVQIGDGAIVVAGDEAGSWSWMFEPHKGEYANETHFLTDEDGADRARIACLATAPPEVAIFSDGLERLLIQEAPQREVVAEFFEDMLPPVRALPAEGRDAALSDMLGEYLCSDAINERTDDDKTLILATRRPYHAAGAAPEHLTGDAPCALP